MRRRKFAIGAVGLAVSLAGCSALRDNDVLPGSDQEGGLDDEGATASDPETTVHGGDDEGENESGNEGEDDGEENNVELEENDPVAVVETFYKAVYAPDVETANEMLHPDSPEPLYSEAAVERFESWNYELSNLEVTEDGQERATVEFELVLTDPNDNSRENELVIELRTSDEQWKIWESNRKDS